MDYYINPAAFSAVFTVPAEVADRHLKLARGEHIKVLLYVMRNMSSEISEEQISENTDVSLYEVKEALLYWADAGILLPKEVSKAKPDIKPTAVKRSQKPDRTDVAPESDAPASPAEARSLKKFSTSSPLRKFSLETIQATDPAGYAAHLWPGA